MMNEQTIKMNKLVIFVRPIELNVSGVHICGQNRTFGLDLNEHGKKSQQNWSSNFRR